ncbi:MAG: HNH endonuclease, partial [Moorea sp. SIO2B7]|nr:HNH endonuclease [Moorena sp. SIO2B7]
KLNISPGPQLIIASGGDKPPEGIRSRAPSLQHRVDTTLTWVKRLIKFAPVESMAMELVRFDLHKQENPEISGIEYQHGTLYGWEVREYLLAKFKRTCQYCEAKEKPLEVEHIQPKSKGGSDRVSNLTLACHECNQAKGNQDIQDFLFGKTDLVKCILKQAKMPLRDAAAVNSTRWALFNSLKGLGFPLTTGSGGLTKFNKKRLGVPKSHWQDASCVGQVPDSLIFKTKQPLLITCKGHGTRQRCRTDKFGFRKAHANRDKFFQGFQTGDLVKASVPKGKFAGNYIGRIAIRHRPSFVLQPSDQSRKFDVHPKYLQAIHRADGYEYQFS